MTGSFRNSCDVSLDALLKAHLIFLLNSPSIMGHKSLIQRRPSLNHPGWLQYLYRHTIRYSKLPYLLSSGLIGRKKEIQTSFCANDVLLSEIMCPPARVIFAMPNILFFPGGNSKPKSSHPSVNVKILTH